MNGLFFNKYRIRSARCCNWDYSWDGAYFITICTEGHSCYFGSILNGTMNLSESGRIAEKFWSEIPLHFTFIQLDAFVIMPNHVHGLLIIDHPGNRPPALSSTPGSIGSTRFRNPGKQNISSVIGSFKSITTKTIRKQIPESGFAWQKRFHDHVVRNDPEYQRIQQYILDNPKNWNADKFYSFTNK